MTATGTPGPGNGTAAATEAVRTAARDVVVAAGRVRIRVHGASAPDLAQVERQFGPSTPATRDRAQIHLRYEPATAPGKLRYLGPDELGHTPASTVVLRGRFRRPAHVRIPFHRLGQLAGLLPDDGEDFEVVSQHGVGRVPHLVALVNLALLGAGGVALHASAFVTHGRAHLATGWSKGGKSEALLAACQAGAAYLADEWVHLLPDGTASGIEEPVRVWDWYLEQLPAIRQRLAASDRGVQRSLAVASNLARRTGRSARLQTAIDRQRYVDLPAAALSPFGRAEGAPVPVATISLMTSTNRPDTTVEPCSPEEVARRMAHSLAYERLPLAAATTAAAYAFPERDRLSLEAVTELEEHRLRTLLAGVSAQEILHPHPAFLADLGRVLEPLTGWAAP